MLLVVLIGVHGLIHILGFLKAFDFFSFDGMTQPISKTWGLFWLFSFMLWVITGVMFMTKYNYWWVIATLAIVVSQLLVVNYWTDAKYGTIANIVLGLVVIFSYANHNFKQYTTKESVQLLAQTQSADQEIIHITDIETLPPAVQKWLVNSGVIGKRAIANVYLEQNLHMKLQPSQTHWYKGTARQYFAIHEPAFNWTTTIEMNPLLYVVGRDKFVQGKGQMLIKLASLFPLVDVKNNDKIDQATLQRYLAEMVWFPTGVLSPYIKWQHIDAHSAQATMEFNGTKGSGVFYFNEEGQFDKFVALRYKDVKDAAPLEWTVVATEIGERNGVEVPVRCEASWRIGDTPWTWLQLEVTHIEYNVKKIGA